MLEINCQYWLDNYDMHSFSNSIANSGDRDCGSTTWQNACEAILEGYQSRFQSQQIITSTKTRRQVLEYFLTFGAWDREELNSMSNIELSALTLQYIAGNYNECDTCDDESGNFFEYGGDTWITLSE